MAAYIPAAQERGYRKLATNHYDSSPSQRLDAGDLG
nr:MAG TPA: hypothetical protein [Caudoviricetes sp.]